MTSFHKRDLVIPLVLLGIAICLRMVFLLTIERDPAASELILDAHEFDSRADDILAGNIVNGRPLQMVPLYPYLLALVYWIFGKNILWVRLLQMFLGLVSGLLLYRISGEVFDRKTGMIALTFYALYGVFIYFETMILATSLSVFSFLAFIFLAIRALKKPSVSTWFTAGLAGGLAVLIRPNILLVVGTCFLYLCYALAGTGAPDPEKPLFRVKLLFSFGLPALVLCLLPVCFNYVSTGEIIPFTAHAGINFYLGNNPDATGAYMGIEGISDSPVRQVEDSVALASREAGEELSYARASRFWFRKGLGYLAGHPVQAVSLYIRKCLLFWDAFEVPCGDSYAISRMYLPRIAHGCISFGMAGPMALLGLIFARNRKRATILVYLASASYFLTLVGFHINTRYRLPLVTLLLIFAGAWIVKLYEAARARKVGLLMAGLALWIFLTVAVHLNLPSLDHRAYEAGNHTRLGKVFLNRGKPAEAQEQFDRAEVLLPGKYETYLHRGFAYFLDGKKEKARAEFKAGFSLCPDCRQTLEAFGDLLVTSREWDRLIDFYWEVSEMAPAGTSFSETALYNLGLASHYLGDYAGAAGFLQESIEKGRKDPGVYLALAQSRFSGGDPAGALRNAEKALQMKPGFVPALVVKAKILLSLGNWTEAEQIITRAIESGADNAGAHNTASLIYLERGQLEKAESAARKAIRLDSRLPFAHYNLGVILENAGRKEEAMRAYREEVRIKPDNYKAYNNLALLYDEHERYDEMEMALRSVMDIRPDLYSSYYLLALAYYKQKKELPEALELVKQSISLNPDFPGNHLLLAELYLALGKDDAAEDAHAQYRKLLKKN